MGQGRKGETMGRWAEGGGEDGADHYRIWGSETCS